MVKRSRFSCCLNGVYPKVILKYLLQNISSSFQNKVTEFRWRSVIFEDAAFDSGSCLLPDTWRGRLSATHLAILSHLFTPQRLTKTIERLWDGVMGPDEHASSTQKLSDSLSIFHSSAPVLLLAESKHFL